MEIIFKKISSLPVLWEISVGSNVTECSHWTSPQQCHYQRWMTIGPWVCSDKHLFSFRGVKKKNCVWGEGGGENKPYKSLYILSVDSCTSQTLDQTRNSALGVLRLRPGYTPARPLARGGGHGSDRWSSGAAAGVPGMGDGGGVPAQPLLEDVHRGRERHHHLHHLREPVDVVRDGLNRGAQLQGIPVTARFEWYVPPLPSSAQIKLGVLNQPISMFSGYIQASRALMITAIVLGTFGLVAALIGIQCSKAGGENYALKGKIAGTGGVLFILQGS